MAGGMDLGTSTKGGKRSLDAAINLVPFIDLMAVTISFLIMTAVWTQIGRIPVSQSQGAPSDEAADALQVSLRVTGEALRLTVDGAARQLLPLVRDPKGRLDLSKLQAELKELKDARPAQQAITIEAEDSVRYDDLVRIIDGCIGQGLVSVQVAPTS